MTTNTNALTFAEIVDKSHLDLKHFCKQYHIPEEKGSMWMIGSVYCPPYVLNLLDRFIKEDAEGSFRAGEMLDSALEHVTLTEMLSKTKIHLRAFCKRYDIPASSVSNWRSSNASVKRTCPEYVRYLLYRLILEDYVLKDVAIEEDISMEALGIPSGSKTEVSTVSIYRPCVAHDPETIILTIDQHDYMLPSFIWDLWKQMHPKHEVELFRNVLASLHGDYSRAEWKIRRAVMHEYLLHEEFLSVNRLASSIYKGDGSWGVFDNDMPVTKIATLTITSKYELTPEERNYVMVLEQLVHMVMEMEIDIYFCLPLSVQTFLIITKVKEEQALVYVYQSHVVCFQVELDLFSNEMEEMHRQLKATEQYEVPANKVIESYLLHRIESCIGSTIIHNNLIEEATAKRKELL